MQVSKTQRKGALPCPTRSAGIFPIPTSSPTTFLNNLGQLQGTKPYIQFGGNTQDFTIYNPDLEVGLKGTVNTSLAADYPSKIEIGDKFFESFSAWANVKYSFGFNLGGNNNAKIADKYSTGTYVRDSNRNESSYVSKWLKWGKGYSNEYVMILSLYSIAIPFVWATSLNSDKSVKLFAAHNYVSGAKTLGVTMANTILNHTYKKSRVVVHVRNHEAINPGIHQIWAETNSFFGQGRPDVSDTFGATLWGIDYCLYSASRISSDSSTKSPYYGNIAIAAFIGNQSQPVRVALVDLGNDPYTAMYTAYSTRPSCNNKPRPTQKFIFNVGYGFHSQIPFQRLVANGTNSKTGISWDGWSYNYELDRGKLVRLSSVTTGETTIIKNGLTEVEVPDSQAVILDLKPSWRL